jgi:hypothetical protein
MSVGMNVGFRKARLAPHESQRLASREGGEYPSNLPFQDRRDRDTSPHGQDIE